MSETHRYFIHAADDHRAAGRGVEHAGSPEEAAFLFVEHYGLDGTGETVSLIVKDCDTGAQQCLTLDLDTGAAAPCD